MEEQKYLDELSKCVRCGTCKTSCSTYEADCTEAAGARGRLALLHGLSSGQLVPSSVLNGRIFNCTLCGACSPICPLGVDVKEVIYHGRNILRKTDLSRKHLRFFTKLFVKHPALSFKFLSLTQHLFLHYLNNKELLPFKVVLPERHLKDNLQVITVPQKKGRVAVFTGCTVNFLHPGLGRSLINVLNMLGYEVILPPGEVCCGTPLRTLGMEKEAVSVAEKNYRLFTRLNVEAVLSLCPTCTLALKAGYPKLIGKGIEYSYDISEFLIDKIPDMQAGSKPEHYKNVLFHDPCHLKYGLGITKEPREILKKTGIDPISAKESKCCGFAGLFCFSNRKLSRNILETCSDYYEKLGPEMIVTSCPGCIIQLSQVSQVSQESKNKRVLHLVEVVENALMQNKKTL